MVDFDKLGRRAGEKGYSEITGRWVDLPDKQKSIIKALILHPEKSQYEIGDLAGSDKSHVHTVIHSLPPEQFHKYKSQMVEDLGEGIRLTPEKGDVDEEGLITVSTQMPMRVQVSIPKKDLETATAVAMGKETLFSGMESEE